MCGGGWWGCLREEPPPLVKVREDLVVAVVGWGGVVRVPVCGVLLVVVVVGVGDEDVMSMAPRTI